MHECSQRVCTDVIASECIFLTCSVTGNECGHCESLRVTLTSRFTGYMSYEKTKLTQLIIIIIMITRNLSEGANS